MVDLINAEIDRITLYAQGLDTGPATGQTIKIAIQNLANDEWFDGVGFGAAYTEHDMTETDSVNIPGYYHYDFQCPDNNLRVKYIARPTVDYVINGPWQGEAQFGVWVTDVVTSRKHVRNKIEFTGGRYTLYEDNKVDIFEEGDVSSTEREPDL